MPRRHDSPCALTDTAAPKGEPSWLWLRALAALTLITLACSCSTTKPKFSQPVVLADYPEFSWDHIPRYMHVWKTTSYTDEELDYLATCPLITFEKAQGINGGRSVQQGTLEAARGVKARNPSATILYYKNVVIDWQNDEGLKAIKGGYLQRPDGTYPMLHPQRGIHYFDLSNPEVRDWWMWDAARMMADPAIDGLFVDANIKVLHPKFFPKWQKVGEEKGAAIREGYDILLERMTQEIRPDSIVIANIIRARLEKSGLDYLDHFDGSYLEAFEHAVDGVSKPDYLARGIAATQHAARAGKIIAFTIGLGQSLPEDSSGIGLDESRAKLEDLSKLDDRINYATALFLVIAEKHSYFYPHAGYGVRVNPDGRQINRLWMKDLPIFQKPLGSPKGPAEKNGYVYTREFEHCSVWLDIENEKATLTWN